MSTKTNDEKALKKAKKREKKLNKLKNRYDYTRPLRWYKLDNTAHVFPVIAGEAMSNVYRISVTLNEMINPALLKEALDIVLPKFELFKVRLRSGFFWYYFEENEKPSPRIFEENTYPSRFIKTNYNRSYLFRVSYYECRINLEVFHVLTDGMGGLNFLRELAYQYLRLSHPELAGEGDNLSHETSLNLEDSFLRNYKESKPIGFSRDKAYRIKLEKLNVGKLSVMHGLMSVSKLKEVSHKYDLSINEYLTSVYIYAIYTECMHRAPDNSTIRVAIPVNLRPYFDSVTTKNFFVPVSAEFKPTTSLHTFEDVCAVVKDSLRSQINKEHLEDLFSYSVSNQDNRFLRAFPLFIKNIAIRSVYTKSALANTGTITNIGNISIDDKYKPYINRFHAFITVSKGQNIKGTICSFNDTLVFTFTSGFSDFIIQRTFFRKLSADGVDVSLETNGGSI